MSLKTSALLVPVGVRGMKILDKAKFLRNVQVPVLKVAEQSLAKVTHHCRPYFLKLENFKPVQNLEDELFKKCVYLNPEKVTKWDDLSSIHEALQEYECTEKNYTTKTMQFGYNNFSFESIFKAVLPEGEEIVSSYSLIGHIVHLNLRDHLIEYRQLIGQVLLDKIKTCRTVVNKSNIIDNTFRNFSMEVIAGEEDFCVTVKENRCTFQFDFSKVYWNPRLGKEHERILSFLKPGDVLFDVFCGVGPFAIPAAKHKCKVFANDLNPDSYKWLNHSAKKNKVNKMFFKSYNQDGKDFISEVFRDYLVNVCKGNEKILGEKIHITMNLPAKAVEFLKYFRGIFKDYKLYIDKLNCEILVYVYCFAFGDDPVLEAKNIVNKNMGLNMSPYILDIFDVRNVSPKKEMMRVTFKLPKEIMLDVTTGYKETDIEPPPKKQCIDKN
ncbi:unnamed protein product [Chilo suppressalis]|uniref:tRNA (guanine(37)-N1)-methyltransferase n=1 Tax=Chilo suppressalis TaxID=168631 RepID=A0ABN8BFR4_CHISP|nr:unnamed protein product [Chilo suppressalis]